MSAPPPSTQDGSRSSTRHKKHPLPPKPQQLDENNTQHEPSAPTLDDSPGGVSENTSVDAKIKKNNRKKSQTTKKPPRATQNEAAPPIQTPQFQPNSNQHQILKATPIKQAYAGPTFHHSPAPSALPMPSFYSRSVPNVSTRRPTITAEDSETGEASEAETFESKEKPQGSAQKRESTPLDFLFEAARKAQETPRTKSPAHPSNLSPRGVSPYSRSPAPREGDMFPFELDSSTGTLRQMGASFATPYRERIDALRSTSVPRKPATPDLDEAERRAKGDALKRLLLNPQMQRPASASPEHSNPFNAREPAELQSNQLPPHLRHHSGPSTPSPHLGHPNGVGLPYFPHQVPFPFYDQGQGSPMYRPPSSHLRHVYQPNVESSPAELSSDGANSPPLISTARKQSQKQAQLARNGNGGGRGGQCDDDNTMAPRINPAPPMHKPQPSGQELEDGLRRFLKLDVRSEG